MSRAITSGLRKPGTEMQLAAGGGFDLNAADLQPAGSCESSQLELDRLQLMAIEVSIDRNRSDDLALRFATS